MMETFLEILTDAKADFYQESTLEDYFPDNFCFMLD